MPRSRKPEVSHEPPGMFLRLASPLPRHLARHGVHLGLLSLSAHFTRTNGGAAMSGEILCQAMATVGGGVEWIFLRKIGDEFVVSLVVGVLEVSHKFTNKKKASALYEKLSADLRRRVTS